MQKSTMDYQKIARQLSQLENEPTWLLNNRLNALKALIELNPPKIERLDYEKWDLWKIPEVRKNQKTNHPPFTNPFEKEGVLLASFQEAILEHEALFKACYEASGFTQWEDSFQAFTSAFLTDSLFVYIPKNKQIKKPLELEFHLDEPSVNRQVLIYAAQHSSVEITENYTSSFSKTKTNANIHLKVYAEEGATVHYSSLDQFGKSTTAFIRRRGTSQKDAKINWALGAMNDGDVIEDVRVDLKGEGSSSDVKTVAITHEKQIQAINVNITNSGRNTKGNIFQHGVALDQSTLTFNGIGHILKGAKNSDAQQESRILMLSDQARADANPILLIDEYEVQAGHAASVSRVDQDQLYYLMSRGLEEKQAEKLIIRGFLGIVLTEITMEEARQELIRLIERKLVQYGD